MRLKSTNVCIDVDIVGPGTNILYITAYPINFIPAQSISSVMPKGDIWLYTPRQFSTVTPGTVTFLKTLDDVP